MQAVLLAGGRGTKLAIDKPKSTVPFVKKPSNYVGRLKVLSGEAWRRKGH